MAVISGILKDPIGGPRVGVVIELRAIRTSATVVNQARSQSITDATGKYTLTVEPGAYDVMITAGGRQPERVGGITVALNSQNGTLNDFLTIPGEADLTPEIVATVDRMRAEAANSAAAAKISETNAAASANDTVKKSVTTDQTINGTLISKANIYSYGEVMIQATAGKPNTLFRFRDESGADKGGIYAQTDTGQLNLRWSGTAYTAQFKPDGTAWFPGALYSNGIKVSTQATSLGALDLNTVTDEGDYYQPVTANATVARNYPIGAAGVLKVIKSRASTNGKEAVSQFYYPWHTADSYFSRTYIPSTDTWSSWEIFDSRGKNDTRFVQIGAYGLGYLGMSIASKTTGFIAQAGATGLAPGNGAGFQSAYASNRRAQLYISTDGTVTSRFSLSDTPDTDSTPWNKHYTTANTTVDANGFIKKASPIVKLFSDGHSELNEQSQGVTTERIDTGHYIVHGVFGFNSDPAWGGPAGGIEIPTDQNKRPLIWVDYTVLPDGDLEIKTYHRAYKTGPEFTRNIVLQDGKAIADGTPIDIPAGRWIDLRVEMPAGDEPESVIEPEPIPDPEVVPDTDQQSAPETEQPATPEPESGTELEQGDTPEVETKE
ncbi:prophage tail fiber N-terminal domain-containing protein [Serratia sp. Ag1]|uniref:phage tail fiber protein n=1 Tax=Serratia sp. Ag1 TaxID=1524467 RepID=UPI00068A81A4|nr:prophage tail fiber N-terminal domain-containing protein [Serratia sp. Ag1]